MNTSRQRAAGDSGFEKRIRSKEKSLAIYRECSKGPYLKGNHSVVADAMNHHPITYAAVIPHPFASVSLVFFLTQSLGFVALSNRTDRNAACHICSVSLIIARCPEHGVGLHDGTREFPADTSCSRCCLYCIWYTVHTIQILARQTKV